MNKHYLLSPIFFVLFSCTASHQGQQTEVCTAMFDSCTQSSDCCAGYCDALVIGYGPGSCLPKAVDGVFCVADESCQSGSCIDATCGQPNVGSATDTNPTPEIASPDLGEACGRHLRACLHGNHCVFENGVQTCQVPRQDGASCNSGAQCESYNCNDTTCVPRFQCLEQYENCDLGDWNEEEQNRNPENSGCCEGTTCTYVGSRSPLCLTPKQVGTPCPSALSPECQSGFCRDRICRASHAGECLPLETRCNYSGECCQGFCSSDGSYGIGFCEPRRPAGAPCLDDTFCESLKCSDERVCAD